MRPRNGASEPSHQPQHHEHEHDRAHQAAGAITPPSAVGPGGNGTDEHEDEDDQQDHGQRHGASPVGTRSATCMNPARSRGGREKYSGFTGFTAAGYRHFHAAAEVIAA